MSSRYQSSCDRSSATAAEDLAERSKHQFELWALSLVDAVPFKGKKQGADSGIDGIIFFKTSGGSTEKATVSVKGGKNIGVSMIRDLKGVIEREHAAMGLFITLTPPTKPMAKEAVSAGFYDSGFGKHQRIQIRTIDELLHGKPPDIPLQSSEGFRKAAQEQGSDKQRAMDI